MQISLTSDLSNLSSAEDIFQTILSSRGLNSKEEINNFLFPPKPNLKSLISETAIKEESIKKAKNLILDSIDKAENILVFGDYDADGITSSAILWQTLVFLAKGKKAKVMPFIPDRTRHGYGLSLKAIKDILSGDAFKETSIKNFYPHLVVTVDNGIVANEAVARLKKEGIKVIITDHHQVGSELPSADAIVHSTATSGAGISWLLSLYLSEFSPHIFSMVDLAAIGVVADQMPLTGLNREIATYGIEELTSSKNIGLNSLKKFSNIEAKKISTYDINFILAPRLNAAGRIDNPLEALRLLCSRDKSATDSIAKKMNDLNSERQLMTEKSIEKAVKEQVDHKIIIVSSPDFHEGIIGLVAGKLVEKYNRPAIVISEGALVSKGSARSLGNINITDLIRRESSYLLSVGGHALAGGLSLNTADISRFKNSLYKYADKNILAEDLEKSLVVEGELTLAQATLKLSQLLSKLEPFGMGNYKPRFISRNLEVLEDRKIGRDGSHRKLVIEQNGVTRDCIWFNGGGGHPITHIEECIYSLEINTWRDRESLQLNIQYVK